MSKKGWRVCKDGWRRGNIASYSNMVRVNVVSVNVVEANVARGNVDKGGCSEGE